MSPAENGRHCKGCDHIVVDFTGMSNQEIRQTLLDQPNTCGHFTNDQLAQAPLATKSRWYRFKFAAAAAVALLGFQMTPLAQAPTLQNPVKYTDQVCPVEDGPKAEKKRMTAQERRMKRYMKRRRRKGIRGKFTYTGCPSF